MKDNQTIAIVIPCYRVADHLEAVLAHLPEFVDHIIVVDDACPEGSGEVASQHEDSRITLLTHSHNQGVGAATITGYKKALELGCDIVIKMDGDGQMDSDYIIPLITPLIENQADYTKGNRFHDLSKLNKMPRIRLFGNSLLSFVAKFVSGYWNLMDSTNGFTAIHKRALENITLEKISSRYFFETDMLVNLYLNGCVVKDTPIPALYNGEQSNMILRKIAIDFPPKICSRLFRRLFYRYFIYDFNMASIYMLLSLPMVTFGTLFGTYHWIQGAFDNSYSSAGTVMLAAMPIILGVQFLLQAIQIDIQNVPKK